jgi:cation:H+ antiporter
MVAASLLLVPFVFLKRDLTRIWGLALSALYMGYVTLVLI